MVINWPARSAPDREEQLESDKLELKAQIRAALADLAARHGIAEGEVDHVMWAYIDQAVRDLTFVHERESAPARDKDATIVAFGRPRTLNS
jgi:hypothetical protein